MLFQDIDCKGKGNPSTSVRKGSTSTTQSCEYKGDKILLRGDKWKAQTIEHDSTITWNVRIKSFLSAVNIWMPISVLFSWTEIAKTTIPPSIIL